MPNDLHTHNFPGVTTFNDGHTHQYSGITGSAADVPGHTHAMMGTTAVNDGHSHNYDLQTSQSLQAMGGHTHNYQSFTSFADRHNHFMSGDTSVYMDPAIPAQFQPGLFGPSTPPGLPGQYPAGRVLRRYRPGKAPAAHRDTRRRDLSRRSRGRHRSPSIPVRFFPADSDFPISGREEAARSGLG
jgi:hypothetical protein